MSEKILKIKLSELKTIRIKIGDVVSEMPLDGPVIENFTNQQIAVKKMNAADQKQLVNLVGEILTAKAIQQTIEIEFLLPGE